MPIYLTRIEIENLRTFESASIPLTSLSGSASWTIFVGDNGVGKSTLLRAIGLGMCNSSHASGLVNELSGSLVRQGATEAKITLSFEDSLDPTRTLQTTTWITDSGLRQDTEPPLFPWDEVFSCGYGAARRSTKTLEASEYTIDTALYTLFNYDSPLQLPELVLRRLQDFNKDQFESAKKSLARILGLGDNAVGLNHVGLYFDSPWGKRYLSSLSDGYIATTSLLTDMLGWFLLWQEEDVEDNVSGILLIDEIEQHLHPSWQKTIVRQLQSEYPNLQVIATTHSALVPIGAADAPKDTVNVVAIQAQNGASVPTEPAPPPATLRADQVLTSYLFGLDSTRTEDMASKIQQYASLKRLIAPTSGQRQQIDKLHNQLKETLGSAETELSRLIERALSEAIRLEAQEGIASSDHEVLRLEIERQLADLNSGILQ